MAGVTSSSLRKPQEKRDEKVEISQITDYLYLSGCTGLTPERLKGLGITCTINCIKGIKQKFPTWVEHLYIPVEDEETENLRPHFNAVLELIEKHRKTGGKTLVYCGLGISRSASFVIAYFMEKHSMSLHDAYKRVQKSRSIICPNVGFFKQLLEREMILYGKTTITIIEPTPGVQVPDVIWQEVYEEVMEKLKHC